MDKKNVRIRLFKDNSRYKGDLFVSVNGVSYKIRRGVEVEVPPEVAEVLEHSQVQDERTAARIAQAEEFISAKPEGYESPIAQGGSNVSGGQKQRLSIARAIAKDPKIYLFDDSFSALDYKTDVALRRALKAQTDNATVLIVAQRISTVLHANQILVLDEGRLVGKGTHAQLMASCLEYQEIARSQLSQKELDLEPLNTEKEGV